MRILFNSKDKKFKTKFGTLRENEGCTVNIHIPEEIQTKEVYLVFQKENGEMYSAYTMFKTSVYDEYGVYSCSFSFAEAGLFFYYFRIKTENEEFSLFKQGYDQTNMEEGEMWQISCIPTSFDVPVFFAGKIMYQIFPDRFCKYGECDTVGKLGPFFVHKDTKELPVFMPDEEGIVQNNDFFGGNLRGITSKLDYLKSLNVGVIYLNPIFKAYSNHRYDTADYLKIDELLGNESDFKNLCDEAHSRGMKIILDGVFSHTGSNSVYFDSENIFGNGAVSNPDSPYKSWFDFKKYPDDYTSWWGIKTLPCVDENNDSYREYIIRNDDSVIAHWLKLGADGFRLDVADELPDSFISELRCRMKQIKPDSFLIGEVWEDASNKSSYGVRRKYFTGGELDCVMNYPFRKAIIDYVLGNDNGCLFRDTVMTICENYPRDVLNSLMNILSTHDTVRILTALGVDNVPLNKSDRAVYKMHEELRESALDKLRVAAFLQFILPGMPCIYYGDEIGTEGFEDPFCRTFFDWGSVCNNTLLDYYRELAKIKSEKFELMIGETNVSVVDNGVVKIDRSTENSIVEAYINVSDNDFTVCGIKDIILSHNVDEMPDKIVVKNGGFVLIHD